MCWALPEKLKLEGDSSFKIKRTVHFNPKEKFYEKDPGVHDGVGAFGFNRGICRRNKKG